MNNERGNQSSRINAKFDYINVLLTNARSLSPKILSLQTMFEEHELDFALITESWLKDGLLLDRDVIDLEHGTNLKILYKNCPVRAASSRRVGGGISIVFNKTSCNFRERKVVGNKFELLIATGKMSKSDRSVAIFCVYVQPRMLVAELTALKEIITTQTLELKASSNPLFFIGGDMNKRDLGPAFEAFNDIAQKNFTPTRGTACLDIMFSNANVAEISVWPPLETLDRVRSDHDCVLFRIKEERERNFFWTRKVVRLHTDDAIDKFAAEMGAVDWNTVLPDDMHPDQMVETFNGITGQMSDRFFPKKLIRIRSNEAPWITEGVRRLSKAKKRVYKRDGKSDLWWRLDEEMSRKLEECKSAFVDKAKEDGPNSRKYYSVIKSLSCKEKPPDWKVSDLYPGATKDKVGDKVTAYFTAITDQFERLNPSLATQPQRAPLSVREVTDRIVAAKKPNSIVKGDLPPKVVRRHAQAVAIPAQRIFNSVFKFGTWPTKWKEETVVVIPKTSNPSSLAECRNISCTPFLSEVLESVLLEDLRGEIEPDPVQYGGIKRSSVDHLLVNLYDKILSALDGGDSAVLLGIDYEKAFNRLDHSECLRQLRLLGASDTSVALVRSFLTGRVMRAKIGGKLSDSKDLNGGSPQGSILGCYLYCSATQQLNDSLLNRRSAVPPTPGRPTPTSPASTLSGRSPDSPAGFDLLDPALWPADSPASSPAPTPSALGGIPPLLCHPRPTCHPQPTCLLRGCLHLLRLRIARARRCRGWGGRSWLRDGRIGQLWRFPRRRC